MITLARSVVDVALAKKLGITPLAAALSLYLSQRKNFVTTTKISDDLECKFNSVHVHVWEARRALEQHYILTQGTGRGAEGYLMTDEGKFELRDILLEILDEVQSAITTLEKQL